MPLEAGQYRSGGRVFDADGREVVALVGAAGPIREWISYVLDSRVVTGAAGGMAPQAVYDAERETTYVAYSGKIGLAATAREQYVVAIHHDTGVVEGPVYAGEYEATHAIPATDGHGQPTIAVDGDGVVHVVWQAHDTQLEHAKSNAPGISSGFTKRYVPRAEVPTGTYPAVAYDSESERIYLLFRLTSDTATRTDHDKTWPGHEFGVLFYLPDGEANWVATRAGTGVVDLTGVAQPGVDFYTPNLVAHDGKLWLSWCTALSNDGSHDGARVNAYVAYYDPADDLMHAPDGTALGATVEAADLAACLAAAANDGIPAGGGSGNTVNNAKLHVHPDTNELLLTVPRRTANLAAKVVAARFTIGESEAWDVRDTGATYPLNVDNLHAGAIPLPGGGWDLVAYGLEPTLRSSFGKYPLNDVYRRSILRYRSGESLDWVYVDAVARLQDSHVDPTLGMLVVPRGVRGLAKVVWSSKQTDTNNDVICAATDESLPTSLVQRVLPKFMPRKATLAQIGEVYLTDNDTNEVPQAVAATNPRFTLPTISVIRTTAQAMLDNTLTALEWEAEEWDTHGLWVPGGATGVERQRIGPIPFAGIWQIDLQLAWGGTAVAGRRWGSVQAIAVDGVTERTLVTDERQQTNVALSESHQAISSRRLLAVGEYVYAVALQSTAASRTLRPQVEPLIARTGLALSFVRPAA